MAADAIEKKNNGAEDSTDPNAAVGAAVAQPADQPAEIETLRRQADEAKKSADAFKDQLLRKAAEFENYKRRSETEFANIIRNANEGLILQLIPILNDFARSLKSGQDARDFDAFFKGVELISIKLTRVLEAQGLVPFESLGKPFDVEYHDALMQMPKSDVPPNTIIEEIERGYKLNDRVLRHAKVIVSTSSELSTPPAEGESSSSADDIN